MWRFVVVLVLALVLPAATHAAGPAVAGKLVDEHGAPVAGGTVTVYPALDVEGETVIEPIGSAVTDRLGRFAVSAVPSPELAEEAAANGGWANLELVATNGRRVTYRAFTTRLDASKTVAVSLTGSASAPMQARAAARGVPCPYFKRVVAETNRYTTVGELHTGRNSSGWFRYGRSADSDIGVGLSYDGVRWSVSGEAHVGNDLTAWVQIRRGSSWAHKVRSSFHYKKYRHATCFRRWWTVKATRWNSGLLVGDDQSYWDNRCGQDYRRYAVGYAPGTSFHRDRNELRRYSFAVAVFGARLSAQSGASTFVQSHWNFGSRYSRYWLCGDNAMPTQADRVFAGY
jgi:hypothetical protein